MSMLGIHAGVQLGTFTPVRSQITLQHVHTTTYNMYTHVPHDYLLIMRGQDPLVSTPICKGWQMEQIHNVLHACESRCLHSRMSLNLAKHS